MLLAAYRGTDGLLSARSGHFELNKNNVQILSRFTSKLSAFLKSISCEWMRTEEIPYTQVSSH